MVSILSNGLNGTSINNPHSNNTHNTHHNSSNGLTASPPPLPASLTSAGPATPVSSQMKILINLNEKDIIRLIIEFLANRELNISMLDLERETGVINGAYSDDILFLRQLILDGQWDDAIEFIQPLKQIESFNSKEFHYLIMKYQYLELLCLKSEANVSDINQLSVDQLVTYLNDLKPYCPSDEEYKRLCLLLTSSRLQDHNEYKTWNPSSGRLQCFKEIYPLVNKFLATGFNNESVAGQQQQQQKMIAQNERLVQLIVKGLLYESCVEYCQARATQSSESYNLNDPNVLLMQMQLSETDASLLSWLHALPFDTFSCPFEEKPLKLNMNKFIKPNLDATWADTILATPIKPLELFPYNAVPSGKSRNTELMSRSLAPQYDGLSFGLNRSQIFTSGIEMHLNNNMNGHQADQLSPNNSGNNLPSMSQAKKRSQYQRDLNDLTRSIALFNLTTPITNTTTAASVLSGATTNQQHQSTDQLNNKSLTSSYLNRMQHSSILNLIKEEPNILKNDHDYIQEEEEEQYEQEDNQYENNVKPTIQQQQHQQQQQLTSSSISYQPNQMSDSSLFKEYQKNKAQIIQQLEEQEKKREEFVKQLKTPNVHNALNAVTKSNVLKNSTKSNQISSSNDLTPDNSYLSPKFQRRTSNTVNTIDSPPSNSNSTSPSLNQQINSAATSDQTKYANIHSPKAAIKSISNKIKQNDMPLSPSLHSPQQGLLHGARSIVETVKFDSLDDITRSASFLPICSIEDQQAVRAVDIHPNGNFYVVGSNSKCLRICPYPNLDEIKSDHLCKPASVLYKKSKHHYGSIYCTAWNTTGNLIATGSNDKTIKLIKFTPDLIEENDSEIELLYHNGTVRDLIFMQQEDNNILISGGAGDCKIHVLDCQTQQSLRVYSGHNGHIYTLFTWTGTKNVFVSGSQDKTCRFWDLRAPEAIQIVAPSTNLALQGSPVASVAVDPSGLLMSSGHEDAACCLYDIRGSRIVQIYKPHTSDIRSVRFSANAYYLLTASYDNKVIITDLHGDLTKPLNWSIVASHNDKIIQARWHPNKMSFVTTSADRTSTVWSLPSSVGVMLSN